MYFPFEQVSLKFVLMKVSRNIRKIRQFSELEFELLLGKIEDLIALRGILLEHLPLIPMEKSKYGRAIAIADQLK